ncbi:MAG TPA: imidazole glycerol phosphate synthase subunit HisH [Gemmatimonadaceae bacterium]|nr:imidazole glycerol phosphate synthase subunit HisH [Gemmatimonadaceae bacterium]
MIALINYGSGNIQALANIYGRLNVPFLIASTPDELANADRLLLPGVGAFDQAMNELDRSGMRAALDRKVLQEKTPILGICVGMQLLANSSEEGSARGLGWIDGVVKKFDHASFHQATHLPHMGWNTVEPARENRLFDGVDFRAGYYFLHSYYFACADPADALAVTEYGDRFTCAVQRDNVYGVQFHPEKSHQAGIQLLKNFALN